MVRQLGRAHGEFYGKNLEGGGLKKNEANEEFKGSKKRVEKKMGGEGRKEERRGGKKRETIFQEAELKMRLCWLSQ